MIPSNQKNNHVAYMIVHNYNPNPITQVDEKGRKIILGLRIVHFDIMGYLTPMSNLAPGLPQSSNK